MSSSTTPLATASGLALVFALFVGIFVDYADSINCYECFGHGCQAQQLATRKCPPNVDRCMTVYSNNKVSPDKVLVKNCSQVWVNWRDECNMVVRVDQLLANSTTRFPQTATNNQDINNQDPHSASASSSSTTFNGNSPTNRTKDVTGYVCTCTGDLCNSGHSFAVSFPCMVAAMAVAILSMIKQ